LIDACGKSRQLERAFMVLEEMQRNGVPTTCFTFTALIDACAKGGQLDRAFHVLGMMKAALVLPNTHT
jgi:pentatricopeptide repeat protein|tara:strand:- start:134 stop:337 length:204 start_codon:yes stop_codon:yes gene_type:complete